MTHIVRSTFIIGPMAIVQFDIRVYYGCSGFFYNVNFLVCSGVILVCGCGCVCVRSSISISISRRCLIFVFGLAGLGSRKREVCDFENVVGEVGKTVGAPGGFVLVQGFPFDHALPFFVGAEEG